MEDNVTQIPMCASTIGKMNIDLEKLNIPEQQKSNALRAISTKKFLWPARSIIRIGFAEVPLDIKVRSPGIIDKLTFVEYDPLEKICQDRVNNAKATKIQKNVQDAVVNSIKEIVLNRFQPYVNLTFSFDPDSKGKYNVYIKFDPTDGCWSYVGTSCNIFKQPNPTMNLGWFSAATIMHEFGHLLGLHHEHQRSDAPIEWNTPLLYLWGLVTLGWDPFKVYEQIISKLQTDQVNDISVFKPGTVDKTLIEFDPNSIMCYYYPAYLTLNFKGSSQNKLLSKKDVLYLNALYPGNGIDDSPRISPSEFYMKVYKRNVDYSVIKIIIKTANDWYSGTDSQVVVSLYDPAYKGGSQRSFNLNNIGNDFERGQTDTYNLELTGIPKSSLNDKPIILSLNGGDDWKVEKISIYYNKDFVKSYTPNVWLGNGKGSVRSIVLENNYGINLKENFQLGFDTSDAPGFGVTIALVVILVCVLIYFVIRRKN
jgi:hypothetical protein